ncbi:MAG: hypothetical protein GY747_00960 [Planctomycetes bacterium]|nr:hypothetical protein [Planctomycetota bacterium]
MILALALVLMAMPQEVEPQGKQQPTAEEVQQWWDGLSEQEQKKYKERQRRFRELEPTMQEELGRRHDMLREERKRVKENLSEAEQAEFDGLRGSERRRYLDERAHENLRQRGEKLADQFPGADDVRSQPEMARRHQQAAKLFEQERGPQVREALRQAVADGWIGEVAGKWLETAPLEEAMSALMEVRKWQFLQQAEEKGLWKEMGFDEQRRREISALPAPEFLRAIRGNREGREGRRGRRGGAGQFGPPGEHPEGMRGSGRDGKGRRGPGPDRGPGQGEGFGPGEGIGPGPGDGAGPPKGPGPGDGLGPGPGSDDKAGSGHRPKGPRRGGPGSRQRPPGAPE